MEEIKIEKLRQIVSRTDKTGNEKVELLVEFVENYNKPQEQVKNIAYEPVLAPVTCNYCGGTEFDTKETQYNDAANDYDRCTIKFCLGCTNTHSIEL